MRRFTLRTLGLVLVSFVCSAGVALAQGALTNGENHAGSISAAGEIDEWTFEATAGDAIALSLAEQGPGTDFYPWLRLFRPDGVLVDFQSNPLVAQVNATASSSGTYAVWVASNDTGHDATGDYLLTLVRIPGPFTVPGGDEGGPLTNGANHAGSIPRGDLDMWTFTANAGDALALSLAEQGPGTDFYPWLRLFRPDGVLVDFQSNPLVAQVNATAPLTGTYTAVVGTADTGHDATGDYLLTLAQTPATFVVPAGDEGGPMVAGLNHQAAIHRGDLDMWTFFAGQGVAISIVMNELAGADPAFYPWIRLRGPAGQHVGAHSNPTTATLNLNAPVSGLYTIVAGSNDTGHDAAGPYEIRVNGAAPAPTTLGDAYVTMMGTPLNVPAPGVLGNDAANGGGVLTTELVTTTTQGVLALSADGSFTYVPNPGFVGVDAFSYRALSLAGPGSAATVTITVTSTPTGPQPPTDLYAASIAGNTVTLRWTPPTGGSPSTHYVLEGGVNPGDVLASIPTGSTDPIYTFTAPTGAFHVRMHTLSGAERSAPSNEIRIFVNQAGVAPSAPANLVGMVNGSSIALAWRNTFEGGAPGGVVLDVSGALNTSLSLGLTSSFQFDGVPGGTYTLSLRAINGAGSSPSSNAVTLTFPSPCSGAPLPPSGFLAYRLGNTIYVMWDPAASGPAPTSFVLDVSGGFTGSFATPGRTLSGLVGPGTYYLNVAAANACGTSAATAPQTVVVP
jgi:hypothetical protein